MRLPLFLSALALAGFAAAQSTLDPHEAPVVTALETMRKDSTLQFVMTGTETVGNTTHSVGAVAAFRRSYDPRTGKESKGEINFEVFQDGVPVRRIVGDGITLRNYDIVRKEVTATVYSFEGNTMPPNYANNDVKSDVPKMLAQLRAMASGPSAQLARFLSELNPAGLDYASRYSTWMPGVRPLGFLEIPVTEAGGPRDPKSDLTSADDLITDPVTHQPYPENGESQWTMYAVERPATNRTVVFKVDQTENPDTGEIRTFVDRLFYSERSAAGQRVVALAIKPEDASGVSDALFRPYTGATAAQYRPVFGVRRSG